MRPSPILLTHFSALLPKLRVLPSTIYFLLSTLLLKCCLLPFFFNLKLSKFIVCYGVYSNVFLSIFSPIPSPSWTHLRRLEKCLNTHTAACSSCLFTDLGGNRMRFLFLKSQLTKPTAPKYCSFCIIQPVVLVG